MSATEPKPIPSRNTITIRGMEFARSHVILAEPFDPSTANIENAERFKSRIRLADGNNRLDDKSPEEFARAWGFRYLSEPDNIAANPDISFGIAQFDLAAAQQKNPDFQPQRDYATRLSWGKGGKGQSLLLENEPELVVAVVTKGQPDRSSRGRTAGATMRNAAGD